MNDTKQKPRILINPPPRSGRCYCCGRPPIELKPFGGPGDPLVGDFKDAILVKTFRDNSGCVGASWECRDCIVLSNDEYWNKINNRSKQSK